MSKIGKSLLRGAEEALAYAKGEKKGSKTHEVKIPKKINVSAIRDKLHMSQSVFATCFGFSIRTIEKWEQGVLHFESSHQLFQPLRAFMPVLFVCKEEAGRRSL